jgi:CheY-like chemotaxis protein
LSGMLLNRLDGELTSEQEKQVQFIRRSAEGLSELVNDLLDIAKVEAGKLDVHPRHFSVTELLGTLRGIMRPLAQNPNLALVVEEAPEGLELVNDEGKISQVLRNLVSNAIKFTEAGEVRVTVSPAAGDQVAFTVRDTGIGIAPHDQSRIFDEFSQLDNPIQKHVRGTGLGLPLSRRLAELLGGSLTVESQPGIGSSFTLTIPRVHPLAVAAPGQGGQRTALVIDDDEIARYILRGFLEADGFTVLEASDGQAGMDLAQAERPTVIFLDLVMPGPSGFEVFASLRANAVLRDVPVIINTSRFLSESELASLAGAPILPKLGKASREEGAALIRQSLAAAGAAT